MSHFPSGPLDVSFESEGMHGWKLCESHEEKKRPNWYFSMGITNSPNTGPKQDHTSGSGTARFYKTQKLNKMKSYIVCSNPLDNRWESVLASL